MLRYFILASFLFASAFSNAQFVNFESANTLGGDGWVVGRSLVCDDDNNLFQGGFFKDEVDFDPSDAELNLTGTDIGSAFVRKFDNQGSFEWAAIFNNTSFSNIMSLDTDADGSIYVLGMFRDSVDLDPGPTEVWGVGFPNVAIKYLVKLDAGGNYQWGFVMPLGVNEGCRDIKVNDMGDIYIVGHFNNQIDFHPGEEEFLLPADGPTPYTHGYILKLSSDGDFIWAKEIPSAPGGLNEPISISFLPDGDFYVCGEFNGVFTPDPNDEFGIDAGNAFDIFMVRYNADGLFQEVHVLAGPENISYQLMVGDCDTDNSGNLYLTGDFNQSMTFDPGSSDEELEHAPGNGLDMFVFKLNEDGSFGWAHSMEGPGHDYSESIVVSPIQTLLVSGTFQGTTDFDSNGGSVEYSSAGVDDIFWMQMDLDGSVNWTGTAGSENADRGQAIATDNTGKIYATGSYEGVVDFNPAEGVVELDALNQQDAFLLTLVPFNLGLDNAQNELFINLYPNPATTELTVEIQNIPSSTTRLIISDMQGKIVYQTSISSGQQKIDISHLPTGAFNIMISRDRAISQSLFLKM